MTQEEALRLAEALVFASAAPVGARALSQLLPEDVDADAVLAALRIPTLVLFGGRSVYHDAVAAEHPDEVNNRILGFVQSVDRQ